MGQNGKVWNREAHYDKKTITELRTELVQFQVGLEQMQESKNFPRETYASFYANHIEYLRMKIAERIGK